MNAAILIAGRELRDRARLFLVATVMAVVPFLVALTLRDHPQTGMAMVATFLAVAFTAVVALMLGISTIGRDLSEKRASFLFSTPVSPAAIWFGKTAAAVLICVGAFAIVALPTYLFTQRGWNDIWTPRASVATLSTIVLCTALFFGGHVASTMLRSRSARVLFDVAFLAVALVAGVAILRPLLAAGAGDVAVKVATAMGVALLATFLLAPVWQLARGRTDAMRNHAALSAVLWAGVAIILTGAAAYVRWVISPPLASVTAVFAVDQSPSGEWVYVSGVAPERGTYMASLLVNTKTGERERLTLPVLSDVGFSPDGRMAAWFENDALLPTLDSHGSMTREYFDAAQRTWGTGTYRLHTRSLVPDAKNVGTPLVVPRPLSFQLSADGSRIALVTGPRVEVYEVATARLLAAQDLGTFKVGSTTYPRSIGSMSFATPDALWFDEGDELRQLDVTHKRATTIGHLTPATGKLLRDGSSIEARDGRLLHVAADGAVIAEMAIPTPKVFAVGQIGASRLLVQTDGNTDRRLLVVNLATKTIEREISGVGSPKTGRPGTILPRYTDDATFIGMDRERRFVVWNARTGAKRLLPS